jgi:putative alpha-1,2-mannosidase
MIRLLKRIDVLDSGADHSPAMAARHLTIFYTNLYRALTFPRRLDEVNSDGKVVHYSPYDRAGRVFDGPLVTDNGLWDTFRTVYPLLGLAYPDHLGNIVQGIYIYIFSMTKSLAACTVLLL